MGRYVAAGPSTEEDEELCVSDEGYTSKNEVIERVLKKLGFSNREAILVDDDPSEISRAKTLCRTLLVENRSGINRSHMDTVEHYVQYGNSGTGTESETLSSLSFRPPPRA